MIQPYAQWKYRITDKLTLNAGLHYQHFLYNNSWSLEPRAGIKWQLPYRQSLSAGFGMHSQTQPIFVYFTQREDLWGPRDCQRDLDDLAADGVCRIEAISDPLPYLPGSDELGDVPIRLVHLRSAQVV